MKLNKIMLAAVMTLSTITVAQAAGGNQGSGTINFKGSIIDAPCSISGKSIAQDIELGAVSKVALGKADGHSAPVNVDIKLENCDFSDVGAKKNVSVTFTGTAADGNAKMLRLIGNSSDAGIVFTDSAGSAIDLGEASKAVALTADSTLNFNAYVQATKSEKPTITPGEFSAVANFQMAYN